VGSRVVGCENWDPNNHNLPLLGTILPLFCPNTVEVVMPAAWNASNLVLGRFPNVTQVRLA